MSDPSDPAVMRHRRRDYLTFWLTALLAAAAAVFLSSIDRDAFATYFGQFPPILIVAVAALAGAVSLRFLEYRGWWSARPPNEIRHGVLLSTVAALGFAAVAVAADVWFGFPQDLNVPWPDAVLFYPSIAFVAEFAFHMLPLTLLVAVMGWRFTRSGFNRRVWTGIIVVAAIEAGFQIVVGSSLRFFVAPHLVAIGIYELLVFRRFGYIPMIWFRLAYYLSWHVIWGSARLDLLF